MKDYQRDFIELAINYKVLRFGSFKLKSGRTSPYFFNAGNFSSGKSLSKLSEFYSRAILDSKIQFNVLFGPAYKGIPLVAGVSSSLSNLASSANTGAGNSTDCDNEYPFAYDRKEAKDHGEGGVLIGSDLRGKRVLIIDDVITAGTAIRKSFDLIVASGGIPVGVAVAIDRQEIAADPDSDLEAVSGRGHSSAVQLVAQELGIVVVSIVQLDSIIEYITEATSTSTSTDNPKIAEIVSHLDDIKAYRSRFGVKL